MDNFAENSLSPWGEGRGEGDKILESKKVSRQTMNRVRNLRCNFTDAEKKLWNNLRNRRLQGFKFKRQYPIDPYIIDFICLEARLVIEVDGGQHAEKGAYDEKRDAFLREKGFSILRFWNNEVLGQTEAVLQRIANVLMSPSPKPSPQGERAFSDGDR